MSEPGSPGGSDGTARVQAVLRAVRDATGAERCSVAVLVGSDRSVLFALEGETFSRRDLGFQPRQILDHFAAGRAAERRADLTRSALASDRSLAEKGYTEVVRAAVRSRDGSVLGILNAIRRTSAKDDAVSVVQEAATAIAAELEKDTLASGERDGR